VANVSGYGIHQFDSRVCDDGAGWVDGRRTRVEQGGYVLRWHDTPDDNEYVGAAVLVQSLAQGRHQCQVPSGE